MEDQTWINKSVHLKQMPKLGSEKVASIHVQYMYIVQIENIKITSFERFNAEIYTSNHHLQKIPYIIIYRVEI